jgi:hypothetical protein
MNQEKTDSLNRRHPPFPVHPRIIFAFDIQPLKVIEYGLLPVTSRTQVLIGAESLRTFSAVTKIRGAVPLTVFEIHSIIALVSRYHDKAVSTIITHTAIDNSLLPSCQSSCTE